MDQLRPKSIKFIIKEHDRWLQEQSMNKITDDEMTAETIK